MKLLHLAVILLDIHLSLGFSDQQHSSIGRAPLKGVIIAKEDTDPVVLLEFEQRGVTVEKWLRLSESEWDRAKLGGTYSIVRNRAVRHADPFALEFQELKW